MKSKSLNNIIDDFKNLRNTKNNLIVFIKCDLNFLLSDEQKSNWRYKELMFYLGELNELL